MNVPPLAKWRKALELVRVQARRLVQAATGRETSLDTEDRRVLETVVIPYFRERASRVLFVGCDWYTQHYRRLFAEQEYWTIDKDPERRRYGAERHIVGPLAELGRHAAGPFDVVLCNGVFGWGLDDPAEVEASFEACRAALAPGGVLVVGWNDVPAKRPFPLESSAALGRFERWAFPPFGTWRHLTATAQRHTFDFYRKPVEGPAGR